MTTVLVIVLLVVIVATLIGGPAGGIAVLIVVGAVLGILAAAGVGVGAWIFWGAISPWVWSMALAFGVVLVGAVVHAFLTAPPGRPDAEAVAAALAKTGKLSGAERSVLRCHLRHLRYRASAALPGEAPADAMAAQKAALDAIPRVDRRLAAG